MEDVFRTNYRQLNPDEVQAMQNLKAQAAQLYEAMGDGKQMRSQPGGEFLVSIDPRCMNRAKVKLEEAVMWATKAITG